MASTVNIKPRTLTTFVSALLLFGGLYFIYNYVLSPGSSKVSSSALEQQFQDLEKEFDNSQKTRGSSATFKQNTESHINNDENEGDMSPRKSTIVDTKTTKTDPAPTRSALTKDGRPYKALWVDVEGPFLHRVEYYNSALSTLRGRVLERRSVSLAQWRDVDRDLVVLWGNRDDYLQELAKYDHIRTIALPWSRASVQGSDWSSLTDQSNLLIQKYYEWSATDPLCHWIQKQGFTKARWDAVYQSKCNIDLDKTLAPQSLEYLYFRGRPINRNHYWPNNGDAYPDYYYTSPPDQDLYLHVAEDVVITGLGDIITHNVKVAPYSCSQDLDPAPPPGYQSTPLYQEVFIATQYWGDQFFHKMLENFPRLAPYLDFLKRHPQVRIHVAELGGYTAKTMEFLGLNTSRLVTGMSRANVVYLPQTTPCGFALIQSLQLWSQIMRQIIHNRFANLERKTLLLIRRSSSRRFTEHMDITVALNRLATKYNMQFEDFRDNPTPTMEESMQLFNRALIIVAPHGAGLANMVYADPGTYVIEGVCNEPHVNMCYQWTAHVLGHRYHGIPSRGGCESVVDVNTQAVVDVVEYYLKFIVR